MWCVLMRLWGVSASGVVCVGDGARIYFGTMILHLITSMTHVIIRLPHTPGYMMNPIENFM